MVPVQRPEATETVTVWRVELGHGTADRDQRGDLSIDGSELCFAGDDGARRRIDLTRVRRVRRLVGSPVVVVEHDQDAGIARTAFYFAKPPPLTMTTRRGVESKRKARRMGAHYLGASNAAKKEDIRHWVAKIREAVPQR
jgi:hypothetical protein